MAWYAELVRRKQWGIFGLYMTRWYSDKLYKDWYDSLTPEQLEKLQEYRRKEREKEKKEAEQAMRTLLCLTGCMLDMTLRRH